MSEESLHRAEEAIDAAKKAAADTVLLPFEDFGTPEDRHRPGAEAEDEPDQESEQLAPDPERPDEPADEDAPG